MSFDTIAPHYRWLESVTAGSLLQRCRTAFLPEIKTARNILLLGEGRGRFLIELVRQNPGAQITCVDASARMLELMRTELEKRDLHNRPRSRPSSSAAILEDDGDGRARILRGTNPPAKRVLFVHADIIKDNWDHGSDRYDAVASHFFLDCFPPEQLEQICLRIAAWTVPGARWLISDFCVPEHGWRHVRARWILWVLYRFFRVTTRLAATRLTPPEEPLRRSGFELRNRRDFNHGLLHTDVWVKA